MNRLFLLVCCVFVFQFGYSQNKYWITLSDKQSHDEQIDKSWYDLMLNNIYIDSIATYGVKKVQFSKWLNAYTAYLTPDQVEDVNGLSFVKKVSPAHSNLVCTATEDDFEPQKLALALAHMNADAFIERGITGKGVLVGVIDAGFVGADSNKYFRHIFKENRVLAWRDFIEPERSYMYDKRTKGDYHGREVWKMIGGLDQDAGIQSGLAINATYVLARTENGDKEHRVEEDDWIRAIEWMDSLGVKIVNTSLGYGQDMDDPNENYQIKDMDGKTTRISQAAQIAADVKGMMLVVSAGNSGRKSDWKIVTAPADAEGTLAVGATEKKQWNKISYSSIGQDFVDYLKPNVSVYSPNGTSFSSPAVAGFVACLMEMDSTLTNRDLISIMEKSSHLYPFGNNYIGYGVPQADRAVKLVLKEEPLKIDLYTHETDKDEIVIPIDYIKDVPVVLFHKKNPTIVIDQSVVDYKQPLHPKEKSQIKRKRKSYYLILRRKEGALFTTIQYLDQIMEVTWKQNPLTLTETESNTIIEEGQ